MMPQDSNRYPEAQHRLGQLQQRTATLGADRDAQVNAWLAVLAHDPANAPLAESIGFLLDEYEAEQRLNPNWLTMPPAHEDLYDPHSLPEFIVGQTTESGVPYGPRLSDCGSLAVTGISGGGKTSLILNIILGVRRTMPNVAILIFDVKGDFSCLVSIPDANVHVHSGRDLRFNLFRPPPGVPLSDWLTTVATYFAEYRGLIKSRHLFLDVVRKLCAHFGVDRDPKKPWPSFQNVLEYLQEMRGSAFGKQSEYKATLINELRGTLDDTGASSTRRTVSTSAGSRRRAAFLSFSSMRCRSQPSNCFRHR